VLLGYSPSFPFRGFGDYNSGLKQISKDLYERILAAFVASAETEESWSASITPSFGPAGEGPAHRDLKKRIAQDPARLLDKPGLRLWKVEWPLPTSVRIDLVLKDAFDRFVAVEVEVDCSSTEIIGPLQCMKYRAMLSYFFDRRTEEVRSILVAHSIERTIRRRCNAYGIETKTIPR
jgi:RecB family endonuclease NucS